MDNIRRSSRVVGGRARKLLHARWIHPSIALDRFSCVGDSNHSGTKSCMSARQALDRRGDSHITLTTGGI